MTLFGESFDVPRDEMRGALAAGGGAVSAFGPFSFVMDAATQDEAGGREHVLPSGDERVAAAIDAVRDPETVVIVSERVPDGVTSRCFVRRGQDVVKVWVPVDRTCRLSRTESMADFVDGLASEVGHVEGETARILDTDARTVVAVRTGGAPDFEPGDGWGAALASGRRMDVIVRQIPPEGEPSEPVRLTFVGDRPRALLSPGPGEDLQLIRWPSAALKEFLDEVIRGDDLSDLLADARRAWTDSVTALRHG